MKSKTPYILAFIASILLAYAAVTTTVLFTTPKNGDRNSTGSTVYQVETQKGIIVGAKGELRADCELRFNSNERHPDAEAIAGDIITTECRVRKPKDKVWEGIGRDY